jgi:hypothetical protein
VEAIEASRVQIARSVSSGQMPPWLPDEAGCVPLLDSRAMTAVDRQTLIAWAESSQPAGQLKFPPDPEDAGLGPPDLRLDTGEFLAPLQSPDDGVSCVRFTTAPSRPFWIRAVRMRPEPSNVVHHMNLFATGSAEFDDPDQLEMGCPKTGRPRHVDADIGLHYVKPLPPGTFAEVAEGDELFLNLHLSTAGLGFPPSEPVPLRVAVDLWLGSPDLSSPQVQLDLAPPDFTIPAGDPRFVAESRSTFDTALRLTRIMPHMHRFGTAFQAELVRKDGSRQCLIQIPKWDFYAHEPYGIASGTELRVEPGDSVEFRCIYDNSSQNQPDLGSGVTEPRDVSNGWQVTQEMCVFGIQGVER